jgi:hypothetical protein
MHVEAVSEREREDRGNDDTRSDSSLSPPDSTVIESPMDDKIEAAMDEGERTMSAELALAPRPIASKRTRGRSLALSQDFKRKGVSDTIRSNLGCGFNAEWET